MLSHFLRSFILNGISLLFNCLFVLAVGSSCFFLLLLVCLNSMSVVVLCVLLPALAAPAFPEHWHAHYWAYLKFSFKNSHSHFPGFLSSVLLHIQNSKNLFILLCNKLHRFFLFLKRSECFSHLPYCFLSPYLIISQD